MTIGRVRQMISKSIFLKVLLCIFVIAVMIFYFKAFFTTGVYFNDTFLKKKVVNSDSHYIGESLYGTIHITVKGVKNKDRYADVIYSLPNGIHMQYTVTFKDASNWDLGIVNIKDEKGNIIFEGFEGEYDKDSPFLYDKSGKPLIEDVIRVVIDGENPYDEDYTVPLKNVADMATFSNDTIRGRYDYLILAIFIFIFTAVDIKFPLFFFKLKHFLDVKDPEPSDFYVFMQRISWYVLPVIGIILMITAIC